VSDEDGKQKEVKKKSLQEAAKSQEVKKKSLPRLIIGPHYDTNAFSR
jgi:hypothetical protein